MFWPFLTTVRFKSRNGSVVRLEYAVSAADRGHARSELERRFLEQEVFGYTIEKVTAATSLEAMSLDLPAECVILLA